MALSAKAKDGLVVVDSLELKDAKTKALDGPARQGRLGRQGAGDRRRRGERGLRPRRRQPHRRSTCCPAVGANVYDILKHDTLVLTRAAVEKLEARFNG